MALLLIAAPHDDGVTVVSELALHPPQMTPLARGAVNLLTTCNAISNACAAHSADSDALNAIDDVHDVLRGWDKEQ
jgi:hypothetical protein